MADVPLSTPPAPANEPVLPDDSQQWADLAKELDSDKTAFEQEAEDKPTPDAPTEPEPKPGEPEPEPDKPRLTYEQLESNQRNTTEALRQEREARRRAEESMQAVHKLIDDLRASRQQTQPQAREPEPAKLPDVHEDPIGHFQAKVEMLERALLQTHQGAQATQQHLQAQAQHQQFWDYVRSTEAEFRKTSPKTIVDGQETSDYNAACEYLRQHRIKELQHLYPDASPLAQQEATQMGLASPAALRVAILQNDAAGIAQRAIQLGLSPAALYYEAAKGRGYKPTAGSKANGKIEATKRGQRASMTISGGESRKSANDLNLSDLADLAIEDPEEFDKQWDAMKRAGKLG